MVQEVFREITRKFAKLGDASYAKALEKYMRYVTRCHGIKVKGIDAFFKEEVKVIDEALHGDLALAFLRSQFLEEKELGIRLWRRGDEELRHLVFEQGHITGWASSDSSCSRILKPLVKTDSEARSRIANWGRNAQSLWTVRASCVAFITTVKDPYCRKAALSAAEFALTESPFREERFVQLGAGWILREIGQADRKAADSFLKRYLHCFSSEGLRYAVEKLPPAKRAAWQNKFKNVKTKETKRQRIAEQNSESE